jgi:hypothetical protein
MYDTMLVACFFVMAIHLLLLENFSTLSGKHLHIHLFICAMASLNFCMVYFILKHDVLFMFITSIAINIFSVFTSISLWLQGLTISKFLKEDK